MNRTLISAAGALMVAMVPITDALANDAFTAFDVTGQATGLYRYGGFNAGTAFFNQGISNCLSVSGFDCLAYNPITVIGRLNSATDVGNSILDPDYLNILPFTFAGPSVSIFYTHSGSGPVELVASFKALAESAPDTLKVAIFRVISDQTSLPYPSDIVSTLVNAGNITGTLNATVQAAGVYGVYVRRVDSLNFPLPSVAERRDWVGLNLTASNVVAAVPEPVAWMAMISGFGFIGCSMRIRRRRGQLA